MSEPADRRQAARSDEELATLVGISVEEFKALSKNEQKTRVKNVEKAAAAAAKEAEKKAAAETGPAKPKKEEGPAFEEEEEDIDPSKYFDNRLSWVNGIKSSGANPYPHKFVTTMGLPQYHAAYAESIQPGAFAEAT